MSQMENNKKEINLSEMTSRERLDVYGEKWFRERDTMGKEAEKNLRFQIAEEAFKAFAPVRIVNDEVEANTRDQDALIKVLMQDVFCNFDLAKSSKMQLSNYISSRMKFRKIDVYREENGRASKKTEESTESPKNLPKNNRYNTVSLDMPIDEDGELNLSDTIEAESDGMENLEFSINAADLFEMIVSALRTQRLRGKTMEFYRVIYTSDIISAEKGLAAKLFRFQHQRMIDEELSGDFVNYCMADNCEGVEDIYYTALKLYGEVVADTGVYQKDEPIPLPMEDKVGVAFLKTSKGNYSKHHSEYKKLIASIQK